ncbi:hypothetical protein [Nitrosopumilus sp.]|uniref:hypothetical protein n=1 Tax=Nitrosopumilus sp. TaxID=2024843 RepID=UPI003D135B6F
MVYRRFHHEKYDQCEDEECTALTAHVRIDGKWTRIGYYGSECKQFSTLNLEQEREDRRIKRQARMLTDLVKKSKKMSLDEVKDSIKRLNEHDE